MSTVDSSLLSARAALSRLFEPSDTVGLALVSAAGPVAGLKIASGEKRPEPEVEAALGQILAAAGIRSGPGALADGLARWKPRVADLAPERDLETIRRLGGELLIPEDERWPEPLRDLELAMPLCLWVRGDAPLPGLNRTVAVVGSRDATGYGISVTGDICSGLAGRGYTVVSGGAYGIDAQAHRAALAAATGEVPATIAVMACGADRFYPAGNEDLLRNVTARGLLVSEVPPGSAPTRWRFLQRNRVIAALSAATVVVEARWRSGALNTAHHAAGLGREVGAVPGPVYSANSAGCHRLLRDGSAVCVTDAQEVAELAGPLSVQGAPDSRAPIEDHDGLAVEDLLLLDALPVRSSAATGKLATVAGLSVPGVRAGLARLELAGLAFRTGPDQWRRGHR